MVAAAVMIFSGAFLAWYLRPTGAEVMGRAPVPTASQDNIALEVGAVRFVVPANYLAFARGRQGGAQTDVDMHALLPEFTPFTPGLESEFRSNAPDARVISIQIRPQGLLTEAMRLQRIYLDAVTDKAGAPGPAGLTQFGFRPATGYENDELFVGTLGSTQAVFRCGKITATDESPSCLRETEMQGNLALSYRFKRAHLEDWRQIGEGVETLIGRFRQP